MTVVVHVNLNGVSVPIELDEQALATIAAATRARLAEETTA